MMSQMQRYKSYRTAPSETLAGGHDLKASGEGDSMTRKDNYDDDTLVSDGTCNEQACRVSSEAENAKKVGKSKKQWKKKKRIKKRRKAKQMKDDLNMGTWNMETMKKKAT